MFLAISNNRRRRYYNAIRRGHTPSGAAGENPAPAEMFEEKEFVDPVKPSKKGAGILCLFILAVLVVLAVIVCLIVLIVKGIIGLAAGKGLIGLLFV